jgi:hypothetical protein
MKRDIGYLPGYEPVSVWVMPKNSDGTQDTYEVKPNGSIWHRKYLANGRPQRDTLVYGKKMELESIR